MTNNDDWQYGEASMAVSYSDIHTVLFEFEALSGLLSKILGVNVHIAAFIYGISH